MSARPLSRDNLNTVVTLLKDAGGYIPHKRCVAYVYPDQSAANVAACFDQFPQGAFASEEPGRMIGYLNAIRLPSRIALSVQGWDAATGNGAGSAHDPAGSWLYVCRMLLTADAGHQSLSPELSPLLRALKALAIQENLEGVAIALPFPGKRERSGTTEFQKQCLLEGRGVDGQPYLSGIMGPSETINVALREGFEHLIALPDFLERASHFALLVWHNPGNKNVVE
ncbi:hypothetical protein [Halocynthiibacter styelae]|uniref:Uncharacterized protein n=1 Tax=Halocynthiibacter styelae TaxID=2761955 RepID=A0A8J7ID84_9RHOB|nr:hypothetical protein [Paenihalocynthiibacter styelae]MBI1493604.1 hypothetical protein [Paenihalocynthiibacter styelae]